MRGGEVLIVLFNVEKYIGVSAGDIVVSAELITRYSMKRRAADLVCLHCRSTGTVFLR